MLRTNQFLPYQSESSSSWSTIGATSKGDTMNCDADQLRAELFEMNSTIGSIHTLNLGLQGRLDAIEQKLSALQKEQEKFQNDDIRYSHEEANTLKKIYFWSWLSGILLLFITYKLW